jgi:hypothetical protein
VFCIHKFHLKFHHSYSTRSFHFSILNETCVYKTQVSFKILPPLLVRTREANLISYLNETCVYKTQVSFKISLAQYAHVNGQANLISYLNETCVL